MDATTAYPLLLDLRGRRAVVVGGGAVATRRTRALLECGALVQVVAPALTDELAALLADAGGEHAARPYVAGDLDGAWVVHTATGDPAVDARVAADAQELRVWCVRADDASASAAYTPAVARAGGDTVVAVGAGGDPRRAGRLRDAAAALLSRALATGELPLRRQRPRAGRGWVALVGGGPGDPGLVTARGLQLLARADVVVVDRLAPRAVLSSLDPDVLVVDVGKTRGSHPVPQDRIDALLVEHAAAGRGVVRLKGGDPYVLGRGGEEVLACRAAGIPVEVVPGVTSAVAVPAAVGIPVTHRGLATGFSVLTGHEELEALPPRTDHTLVLLMGVGGLERSCARLLHGGWDPDLPVAVVEDGFGPRQRATVGTLSTIAGVAAARDVRPPAVVIVGQVVRLVDPRDVNRRDPGPR